MNTPIIQSLIASASAPYRAAGHIAWHFARGKLGGDPVFPALLEQGLVPDNARILDIGCGQGLLAAWLVAARTMRISGNWPAHWPAAPNPRSIHGIDVMPRYVEQAQRALGSAATFTVGDMCKVDFGQADAIFLLDVLHYVSAEEQDKVLQKVHDALAPGGILIMRIGDASGGLSFKYSVWIDRVAAYMRRYRSTRLYCRSLPAWHSALHNFGFTVKTLAMHRNTPFANVLLVASPCRTNTRGFT
jgi:SAM-dependent methyltransferase